MARAQPARSAPRKHVISVGDDSAACVVSNFQITGLQAERGRELALLLRAGSLAAPLYAIVEQRSIGPSLGQDNIDRGVRALASSACLPTFAFMAIYYRGVRLDRERSACCERGAARRRLLSHAAGVRCRCPASPASCSRSAWQSTPTS